MGGLILPVCAGLAGTMGNVHIYIHVCTYMINSQHKYVSTFKCTYIHTPM